MIPMELAWNKEGYWDLCDPLESAFFLILQNPENKKLGLFDLRVIRLL